MQRETPINPPTTSLNPLRDAVGVASVDYSSEFDGLVKKLENLQNFIERGTAESAMLKYLPGLAPPVYQGQLKGTNKKKNHLLTTIIKI